jgi:spore coat protein H
MSINDNLSIPHFHITVIPEQLKKLNNNMYLEQWIPAVLRLDQDEYQIKLAYRGSHTRKFPKKSYQVKFISPMVYKGEREFHLNAEFADPSLIRNKLSFDFFTRIGALSPQTYHVLLYINEQFAGIYLKLESVDNRFLQTRELPDGPIYYAINSNANFSLLNPKTSEVKNSLEEGYMRKCGTAADDADLRTFIYKINTTPVAQFEAEIEKLLDVDSYLRWLAGAVCTQNFDGFIHNYALYRNRETERFTIIPWDYDATWGRNVNGRVLKHTYLPIEGFNTLTARILDVSSFRLSYCSLLHTIFREHFTEMALEPEIISLQQLLHPFIHLDPYVKDGEGIFLDERGFILSFIEKRRTFLMESIESFQAQKIR